MVSLTAACKANHALVLPGLLAAGYANQADGGTTVSLNYEEDLQSVGPNKEALKLITEDGNVLYNDAVIHYLRDNSSCLQLGNTDQVSEWIVRSLDLTALDFKSIEKPLNELESHFTLRSFIVGYSLTLADIIVWGTIRGNKVSISTIKKRAGNILRWFSHIEAENPWINQIVLDLEASVRKKRAAGSAAGASYEIGLSTENIVTRFPPEPSGYLHIGHAKAALLNDFFAHKQSGGTMICRFDDTNPSKENAEFQDSILHDLQLLGITPDRVSYSSDYFDLMFDLCTKLISSGKAYADNTDKAIMNHERRHGIASKCRYISVDESLSHLLQMKSGSPEGQAWCIRAKISVDDLNRAMRDPVIYRCNPQPHHRTGDKWKIYPTYDFCAPILDSIEGVTYALRTNEYRDRNAQYAWMQQALGLREVTIWDFSRINFVQTVLSKRKLALLVEKQVVWNWDDPRMPTIRGIRRRGMTISALREFILKQGPSRNIINLDWTSIWAINKKYIDPIASRYTAILKEGMVYAKINGIEGLPLVKRKQKHPKNPELGLRNVVYSRNVCLDQADALSFLPGEEITLMAWGNAIVRDIIKCPKTQLITYIEFDLHLEGDFKKTGKKITWLSQDQDLIPAELVDFDHLITKDKLEKEDDIMSYVNWKSESRSYAWVDVAAGELRVDDTIQLERKGYYRVDRAHSDGQPLILFSIPTGKIA
ncbi:glutamyl-tRNA synthetase [Nannizzia gypsea CBS 118893]|uniref:glutamate--tRNA ligase n=1 Tax=Arthroderma gypseum (strain ATCC MYA-4604 / CBS 118893) TaxID=535722 RepID=E4UVK5_ARTGP|nr:glutamyl-tRNA synthetase [Nannizzia gypsea CBS 118893]EFR02332.1 glutamyl-tRNA synthetase [Nannizzia gypsea CBS 118893]